MPLTKKGKKTLANMRRFYGRKKGKQVFYAAIKAGKLKGMEMQKSLKKHKKRKKGKNK